jgi:ABC-type nitrate/sulfonate/bicarbonate transport system substrate-binding protein
VTILHPAGGPENVRRVAAGGSDFCLTSVTHYVRARAQTPDVAARFVSAVVRRSPLAGFVPEESPLTTPADLGGRRMAGGFSAEYRACLDRLGLEPPERVDVADAPAALAAGDVDVVPEFIDCRPRVRRQAGIRVRGIPVGPDLYSSGLVAADRLPADLVRQVQAALADALEAQRQDPKAGLDELERRYPDADPADALEGWQLAEPYIFTGPPPGESEPERWVASAEFAAAAHGLPVPSPESIFRPDVVGPAS